MLLIGFAVRETLPSPPELPRQGGKSFPHLEDIKGATSKQSPAWQWDQAQGKMKSFLGCTARPLALDPRPGWVCGTHQGYRLLPTWAGVSLVLMTGHGGWGTCRDIRGPPCPQATARLGNHSPLLWGVLRAARANKRAW